MNRQPLLPAWAESLKLRYLSGEASIFLLNGNVRDVYPHERRDGGTAYVNLRQFLERFLGRSKDIVVYYNVSEGLRFPDVQNEKRFMASLNVRRAMRGEPTIDHWPVSPDDVLVLLEDLITDQTQRAAVIIDYVETIVPMAELSMMDNSDKSHLVRFQRWSSDPALLASDNLVVMVTENLSDIHRRVVSSPQLATVSIPLPDADERTAFVRSVDQRGVDMEMAPDALAKVSAGLSLVQVHGLFRRARQSGEAITFRTVSRRKKAIIEQECHGLVEFVDPDHDFSHVGGMERLKRDLMNVASSIKSGRTNRVPMGILFVGPMGTGKTYVAEAFAAESGLTCLKFKNFRDKWVGSTEGNLEKILQVVDGLGYVLLIIDEADRSMGGRDGDGGTSSRVIARLKEFMSDTTHRGRVVVLMMSNRPDKLDADLKRPGRLDLKIPFFFPEEVSERQSMFEALIRKNKLQLGDGVELSEAAEATAGYSSAELEAVLLAAANYAADASSDVIRAEDLATAVGDVIPSRDTRMLEYMEMLAVFESSSRRMLPERYRTVPAEEVHTRLDLLRTLLGKRI